MTNSNGDPEVNNVEVVIAGEIVTLTSTESPEYIQRVARYIDKKIASLQQQKKVLGVNSFMKTLLISLNITDDLFKEIVKNETMEKELEECSRQLELCRTELSKLTEENMLLLSRLKSTQMELTNARTELYEYIEAFDKEKL